MPNLLIKHTKQHTTQWPKKQIKQETGEQKEKQGYFEWKAAIMTDPEIITYFISTVSNICVLWLLVMSSKKTI